jgi:hypothetical protein
MKFNEEDVRKFYSFFNHQNPTEIRVFDTIKYPNGESVFVKNEDEFVTKCKYYCDEEVSVYIGARDRKARGDKNVVSSSFVFFEIDEHGEDKDSEKNKILDFLKEENIQVGMQGMSGGGWHFYIPHKLQEFGTSEEALLYKEWSLNSFKKVMLGKGFDVDPAVFNLERVTRVLGTFNYKREKISRIDYIEEVDVGENTAALMELLKNYKAMPKVVEVKHDINEDDFIKELKENWVSPNRERLALSLAGYLRKQKRLGLDSALSIVKGICEDCNDDEINSRLTAVRETYNKDEKDVIGITGLQVNNISIAPTQKNKQDIELPGKGVKILDFADELAENLSKQKEIFYRQDSRQVIEVGNIKGIDGEITHTRFIPVRASRFITLIEKYFNPWEWIKKNDGTKFAMPKSMTKDIGNTVLDSHSFEQKLPSINRIFTVQTPIIRDGVLTFPNIGYDERFDSWTQHNAPKIDEMDMPLEEAKKIIYNIFNEFCFEKRLDYINAISALLTPLLRGIFKTGFNTRTPIYAYMANRERSGKDYLAGITGILYEGCALEEPPISNGEYRSSGGNEELRKKIISAMISGKKRLHFSNNKGHLNSSVLESVTTASRYSDRLLGKNEDVTFDNEIDFSFSGNIGITLTPDLANRTLFINLFLDMEDANKRKFANPNLHGTIMNSRNKILSALYALIRNWFDNGCPDGKIPFASFPEWSRVCGGIMESAGYENPCTKTIEETGISIDSETDEMKELFELCYAEKKGQWITKEDIKLLIMSSNIMSYMDWSNRSHQTKFGIKINKFVGRVLSDIRLIVETKTIRSSRWRYEFKKNEGADDKMSIFSEKSGNVEDFQKEVKNG